MPSRAESCALLQSICEIFVALKAYNVPALPVLPELLFRTQTMPLFVPLAETTGPPLTPPTDAGELAMATWLMDALLMLNSFIAWDAGWK